MWFITQLILTNSNWKPPMIGNSHAMTISIFQISKFNTSMIQSQWTVFQLVNIQLDIHSFCKKEGKYFNILGEVRHFSNQNLNWISLKNQDKFHSYKLCFCYYKKETRKIQEEFCSHLLCFCRQEKFIFLWGLDVIEILQ